MGSEACLFWGIGALPFGFEKKYTPETRTTRETVLRGAVDQLTLTDKVAAPLVCDQAATRWFEADFMRMRNSLGDSDAMRRKLRLKCDSDWNPTS